MGLFDRALASSVHLMPRALVRKVAMTYVAGERLEDAITEIKKLNADGCMATIDLLGESIRDRQEAMGSAETYLQVLEVIYKERVDANISIKPTHFGLALDPELFRANLRRVVNRARDLNLFTRIDMEDSPWTSATLESYRTLRAEGFDRTGVVLQASLRRTPQDLRQLSEAGLNVRLCKGVYREPAEIAWESKEDIRRAYGELLSAALADRRVYLAIATHDDALIEQAERLIKAGGLGREQYEFQMLLGVKPELRGDLVRRGHRVRVYVPFGKDWYAYSVRRLKENPKFAGYITLDVLKDPARIFGRDGKAR